ncbi:MAG: hypothetical protein RJB39_63 [Candidatus Parcubacteria bacterium]|jgi:hypothetical protein
METNTTLPNILKNTPELPAHRFGYHTMASRYGISYLDVFATTARLQEGVTVVGWRREGETAFMVMFEMPDGQEVFFHYSEKMFTVGLMKDVFENRK